MKAQRPVNEARLEREQQAQEDAAQGGQQSTARVQQGLQKGAAAARAPKPTTRDFPQAGHTRAAIQSHIRALPRNDENMLPEYEDNGYGNTGGNVDYKIPPRTPTPQNVRDQTAAVAAASPIPARVAVAVAYVASGLDQTARGKDGQIGAFAMPDGSGGVMHDLTKWRENATAGVQRLTVLHEQEGSVAGAVRAHLGADGLARVRKVLKQFPTVEDFPKGDRGVMTLHPVLPVQPTFLSDFGIRKAGAGKGDFHSGIDIAAPMGTPVLALTGGKVTAATRQGAAGNFVTVRDQSGREWVYAHLQDYRVKQGAVVKPGDRVGSLGMTGAATGPHLHLAVRVKGVWGNPLPLARRSFGIPVGKPKRVDVSADDFAAPAKGGQRLGPANGQAPSPLTGQPSRAQAWQNLVNQGPVAPETAAIARQAGAMVP